eukprot:2856314-Pyramimonas_sp.AAC.1
MFGLALASSCAQRSCRFDTLGLRFAGLWTPVWFLSPAACEGIVGAVSRAAGNSRSPRSRDRGQRRDREWHLEAQGMQMIPNRVVICACNGAAWEVVPAMVLHVPHAVRVAPGNQNEDGEEKKKEQRGEVVGSQAKHMISLAKDPTNC